MATQKAYFRTITLNSKLDIGHHPNQNLDPKPNLNSSRRKRNIRFARWSHDQNSFLPMVHNFSDKHFNPNTLRHMRWFGINEQKYIDRQSAWSETWKICAKLAYKQVQSIWLQLYEPRTIYFPYHRSRMTKLQHLVSILRISGDIISK